MILHRFALWITTLENKDQSFAFMKQVENYTTTTENFRYKFISVLVIVGCDRFEWKDGCVLYLTRTTNNNSSSSRAKGLLSLFKPRFVYLETPVGNEFMMNTATLCESLGIPFLSCNATNLYHYSPQDSPLYDNNRISKISKTIQCTLKEKEMILIVCSGPNSPEGMVASSLISCVGLEKTCVVQLSTNDKQGKWVHPRVIQSIKNNDIVDFAKRWKISHAVFIGCDEFHGKIAYAIATNVFSCVCINLSSSLSSSNPWDVAYHKIFSILPNGNDNGFPFSLPSEIFRRLTNKNKSWRILVLDDYALQTAQTAKKIRETQTRLDPSLSVLEIVHSNNLSPSILCKNMCSVDGVFFSTCEIPFIFACLASGSCCISPSGNNLFTESDGIEYDGSKEAVRAILNASADRNVFIPEQIQQRFFEKHPYSEFVKFVQDKLVVI